MIKQTISVGNKTIEIFDDATPLSFRHRVYDTCKTSYFRLGWNDSAIPERKPFDYNLHSTYNEHDIENLGILPIITSTKIIDSLDNLKIKQCIVNLSVASDVNFAHTHPEKKVLLYYANLEWQEGWAGETVFYSEDLKDIVYTSQYTPGRFIVFDADIPHSIRPQSTIGPKHRFTLSLFWD
jgi:hypothetical protein